MRIQVSAEEDRDAAGTLSSVSLWQCWALVLAVAAGAQSGTWAALTSMRPVGALVVGGDGVVYGATPGGVLSYNPGNRTYTRFTRVDGLAGNRVLSASLDLSGDLWFGTDGTGLSRFQTFASRFDPPVKAFEGLRTNALIFLEDRLYVGTDIGISVFLPASGRVVETYRQLGAFPRDTEVRALALHDGRLWAATTRGVARAELDAPNLQDPDSWVSTGLTGDSSSLLVHDDTLYCGGARAAWRHDDAQGRWMQDGRVGRVDGLGTFGRPPTLVAAVEGRLLVRRDTGSWEQRVVAGEVRSVSRGSEELWIGTDTRLAAVGAPAPPPIRDTPANHFFDIEVGSSGDLWVASMRSDREGKPAGVYRFDGDGWEVHGRARGLPSEFAVSVARDQEERIWVGTWEKGIAVLGEDGVWRVLNQLNSVLRGITQPSNPGFVVISDIQRDAAGLMWIANVQAGLAVMDTYPPRRSHLYGLADLGLPPGANLSKLAIGPDGLKWVASPTEGLVLFDDGGTPFERGDDAAVVVSTSGEPRLRTNNVTAVAVAPSGVLWVGTGNGLHRLRVDYDRSRQELSIANWREYRLEHGLNSTFITTVAFDDQGNVWVGSRAGLTQLRTTGKLVTTFTAQNSGLIDDRVESLTYDASTGTLWIGTFGGLGRLQVGLGRGASDDAGGATAYPNPFVIGSDSQSGGSLTIAGLPLDATVHLFSLEGALIRILVAEPGATAIVWDGTDQDGDTVGSGIVLYATRTRDGRTVRGKVAVVRAR
jgi:ligand-binding sensor domain-containing protein